jgi:hypothetical protein
VVFAFAPIEDGTRSARLCARKRVFRWRRFSGSRRPGADLRPHERPELERASHPAFIRHAEDICIAFERTIRQTERATDVLE